MTTNNDKKKNTVAMKQSNDDIDHKNVVII